MSKFFKWYQLYLVLIILSVLNGCSCNDNSSIDNKNEGQQEIIKEFKTGPYSNKYITDGPYFLLKDNKITVKWIEKDSVIEHSIANNDFSKIQENFGFSLDFISLLSSMDTIDYEQTFHGVEKMTIISDPHGQYALFAELLKKHGIINNNNDWSYGSGHLVVNGDIFNRGETVTEIFWLVVKLEQQAKKNGGKVHFLIGNHELMVLNNDLRYVNKKYMMNAKRMGTTYDQLYAENSIIGKWLRTKPVIISINDILFVHAGISPEFVTKGIIQHSSNIIFQKAIIDEERSMIKSDPLLDLLEGSKGPVWYRGYFRGNSFNKEKLDIILKHFDKKRIIVGHTTQDSIVSLYDGKILCVDTGIKKGKTGEVLIYENGKFYKGTLQGEKIEL